LLSKVDIFDIRNNFFIIYSRNWMLWIALKSWYLWYSEQHKRKHLQGLHGCELLSKVDIFDIRNNQNQSQHQSQYVVNCSQKLISLIFGTTVLNVSYKHK